MQAVSRRARGTPALTQAVFDRMAAPVCESFEGGSRGESSDADRSFHRDVGRRIFVTAIGAAGAGWWVPLLSTGQTGGGGNPSETIRRKRKCHRPTIEKRLGIYDLSQFTSKI
jgi:hypothetical protein